MNHGKNVCKVLKEIRRKVADENEIPLEIRECTFEGDCKGTCPYCEAEVRYLERELRKRRSLGKAVTVAGLALSSVMLPGCQPLQGDPVPPEEPSTEAVALLDTLREPRQNTITPPPEKADETEWPEVILGMVKAVPDKSSEEDSALLREEIPLIDEIPDDSGLDTIVEPLGLTIDKDKIKEKNIEHAE